MLTACQQHYLIRTVPDLLLAERGCDLTVVSDFDQTFVDAKIGSELETAILECKGKLAAAGDSTERAHIKRELRELNMQLQCVVTSKQHSESKLANDPAELARLLNELVPQLVSKAEVARRKLVFEGQ
jgi:hypothetical protein